jgi:hypothetical protein
VEEGSTNAYLTEPRAIEEFLKTVEPRYNEAVDALAGGSTADSHVGVVAGFIAYVASCSPTAMRLFAEPLRVAVEATAAIMEAHGRFPPPPEELKRASLADLIRDGSVEIQIDHKFPQALGVTQVMELVRMFESFDWDILHSRGKPFLTSDYPTAIEETGPMRPNSRIVALSPEVAVRLVAGENAMNRNREMSAPGARQHRVVGGHEVVEVNRTIVRCAEQTVFFRDDAPWVDAFVQENRSYRVVADARRIPRGRGSLLITAMRVAKVNGGSTG